MPDKPVSHRSPPPVVLAEALDLPAAAPLAADLLIRRGQEVTLDASNVRRLGGQCLQVLLAARATWQADGQIFRIVTASSDFAEGSALLGAGDLALHQDS
jgi:chemotaxis protein CheX